MPADNRAGENRQAVDEGVEQGAEAAVLTGDAGEKAVEVVACCDQPEDGRSGGIAAVAGFEGQVEEERQRRQPCVANQVGDRPWVERLALARLPWRRATAVEADEPAQAPAAKGGALSH